MMIEKKAKKFYLEKWIIVGILLLVPNSGYLASFAEASIFYLSNVFLHVGLGVLLFLPILFCGRRYLQRYARAGKELGLYAGHLGYWFLLAGMSVGLFLTVFGTKSGWRWVLYAHIVLCVLGVIFFLISIRRVGHQISIDNPVNTAGRYLLICVSIGACIPILVKSYQLLFLRDDDRIHNPHAAPVDMAGEAQHGEQGAFYPSSIATPKHEKSDGNFLLRAETCGENGCHPDIYQQWQSSAHRYSDFKNPWYRAAISDAEAQLGAVSTKWCAGCHTPATLLRGEMQSPASEYGRLPSAQAGISCTVCHAIVDVRGTMGQAGFIIEKPKLFDMLDSENAAIKKLYAWFVHLDPAPHRDTFRRPFLRNENGAFCSSCHKGHTDQPLNQARWLQIMNDYDSWQASSFGQGDRDFARAQERKDCVACHLPHVPTADGSGRVRDHRFLGANTLLPALNNDQAQLQATIDFQQNHRITLDIFAASLMTERESAPAAAEAVASVATVIAAHDEWSRILVAAPPRDSLLVPITGEIPILQRGRSVRLEVVVRSRDIGHYFPAGAADLAQAWLEIKVVDDAGKIVFWSGARRDNEVDSSAHFYGVEMIGNDGRSVSHVQSWKAAAAGFVNLLPPNGAEVVRYRVQIPEDCSARVRIFAKLNYRKYRPAHLQRLASAIAQPAHHAGRHEGNTSKPIAPPVVEIARAEATLRLATAEDRGDLHETATLPVPAERWQNYGIGLMRQNELAQAEYAFAQALQAAPEDAELAINLGIIQLRTGRVREAKAAFQKVIEQSEESARAQYYLGMALKAEGDFRKALNAVKKASDLARRDREFRIEIGRLYHALGDYERAIRSFKRALRIDPEDPTVYHEMMQTYLAKGDAKSASRVEVLYRRFAKDESLLALERKYRARSADTPSHVYHEHHSGDFERRLSGENTTNGR